MSFEKAYSDIESRMKALAEQDGDVFLPNVRPTELADYVLISMEPSLGRWASSPEEARGRVDNGFRNFVSSIEDFIIHFCLREYLCKSVKNYHITDISKGAMLVKKAGAARTQRYDRWYGLLLEEIEMVAKSQVEVLVFGNAVARFLERRSFPRSFIKLIHFSALASKARNDGILGREDLFRAFKESVSIHDLLSSARKTFEASEIPDSLRTETLDRLTKKRLTESQLKLIFNYKTVFESMQAKPLASYS